MPDYFLYWQVVIGSGAAGLLSVIIANGLGKTCALVEQHAMGGDCLNVGCVPSKVSTGHRAAAKKSETATRSRRWRRSSITPVVFIRSARFPSRMCMREWRKNQLKNHSI